MAKLARQPSGLESRPLSKIQNVRHKQSSAWPTHSSPQPLDIVWFYLVNTLGFHELEHVHRLDIFVNSRGISKNPAVFHGF